METGRLFFSEERKDVLHVVHNAQLNCNLSARFILVVRLKLN